MSACAVAGAVPIVRGARRHDEQMEKQTADCVARNHRRLKWFWAANLPLVVALYFLLPSKYLLLYLAIVSVYANFAAEAGTEQSAEARIEAGSPTEDDPDDDTAVGAAHENEENQNEGNENQEDEPC